MIPSYTPFQYKSTYVGNTLQEETQANEISAKLFNQNLESFNKLSLLKAGIRAVSDEDQSYVNGVFKELDETVDKLADNTQGGKRWDLANGTIAQMALKLQGDPKLNAIMESYKGLVSEEEQKMKIRQDKNVPISFSDASQHKTLNPDGTINIYRPVVEAQGNYLGEMQNLVKNIAPDQRITGLTPTELQGIYSGKTIKNITPEKVRGLKTDLTNTYLGGAIGQQDLKLKIQQGMSEEEAVKKIGDNLLAMSMLGTYSQEQVQYVTDQVGIAEIRASATNNRKVATKGKGLSPESQQILPMSNGVIGKTPNGNTYNAQHYAIASKPAQEFFKPSLIKTPQENIRVLNQKDTRLSDTEFENIDDYEVVGFVPHGELGKDLIGGIEVVITTGTGKDKKKISAVVPNPYPEYRNVMTVAAEARRWDKEGAKTTSKPGHATIIPDQGGLLRNGYNSDMTAPMGFIVDKTPEGGTLFYPAIMENNKWKKAQASTRADMHWDESYTLSDIDNMTRNELSERLAASGLSKKQITEIQEDPYTQ